MFKDYSEQLNRIERYVLDNLERMDDLEKKINGVALSIFIVARHLGLNDVSLGTGKHDFMDIVTLINWITEYDSEITNEKIFYQIRHILMANDNTESPYTSLGETDKKKQEIYEHWVETNKPIWLHEIEVWREDKKRDIG